MNLSELVSPEEITRRIKELGCMVRSCSSKGHPYQQQVLGYSSILGMAFVKCTNCRFVYERRATKEERENYYRTLNGKTNTEKSREKRA